MGADFISYTLVGPYTLSSSKRAIDKATKRFIKLVDAAVRCQELEDSPQFSLLDGPAKDRIDDEIQELLKQTNLFDSNDLAWAAAYKDSPFRLIDELFDVWHNPPRDSSCRRDPRDSKRKIWVSGEMTWGDEPDGYGWQTVHHADLAGILSVFGIE